MPLNYKYMTNSYENSAKLIRANAGSGKTYALTSEYLRLLFKGESADKILAITFTKKAAGEIFIRIIKRLANAVISKEEEEKLFKDLNLKKNEIKISTKECFDKFISLQHRNLISTMDSFFSKVATVFSTELGYQNKITINDEIEKDDLYSLSIQELCRQEDPKILLLLLKDYFNGTGKNSIDAVIKDKLVEYYEIYETAPSSSWHNFKARERNKEKYDSLITQLRYKADEISPDSNIFKEALRKDIVSLTKKDYEDFLSKGIALKVLNNETKYSRKEIPQELIDIYKEIIDEVKNEIYLKINAKTNALLNLLKLYANIYKDLRQKLSITGFDDLKFILKEILINQNLQEIYYRLDTKIRHIFLDEFQDTSLIQWDLISPIVEEILSGGEDSRTFFCVGDPKQAIYGWRGGVSQIFEKISKNYKTIKEESLVKTYRSYPEIVGFVNYVFQNLDKSDVFSESRDVINSWVKNFPTHEVADNLKRKTGSVFVKKVITEKSDDETMYEEIAQRVNFLHKKNADLEIGVLCRKNDEVSAVIKKLKEKYNLSVSQEGGSYLIESKAVTFILGILKYLAHPSDQVSLYEMRSFDDKFFKDQNLFYALNDILEKYGFLKVVGLLIDKIKEKVSNDDYFRLLQLEDFCALYDESNDEKDIDNFISQVRSLRKENETSSKIRVMTVHSAKGLEFDAVVFPVFWERSAPPKPISFYYEDRTLAPKRIFASPRKEASIIDEEIKEAKKQEEEFNLNESLCCLYVALTRAKYSLSLIIQMQETKTVSKAKNFSRMLDQVLQDRFQEATFFETINIEKFLEDLKEEKEGIKAEGKIKREIFKGFKTKTPKIINIKSPSNEEGKGEYDLKSKFNFDSIASLNKGTLFHRFYEKIDWLSEKSDNIFINNQKDYELSKENFLTSEFFNDIDVNKKDIENVFNEFKNSFSYKKIKERLLESYYKKINDKLEYGVLKEEPFMFKDDDGEVYKGFIDRVVIGLENKKVVFAQILDFKSDVVDEDKLKERALYYKPQIDIYRHAIKKRFKDLKNISSCLLFVRMGEVIEVGDN